ncbi:MAG: hypothetical protein MK165_02070 [Pirellulaceae bacterium]|nr:hypothetical protein [Pirellulaceae bacterium]
MPEPNHPFIELLKSDRRFKVEAYHFVRESLAYAHNVLKMGASGKSASEDVRHLTGQQLCEAIRRFALEQYGMMAEIVLNEWGIHSTGDFGEIVYNLIGIEVMKKSESDRREDFDDVYSFDKAFREDFQIKLPE